MSLRKLCAVGVAAFVAGCSQTVDTNPAQSPSFVAATLGYDAYKQGDLQKAETQFETALSEEPDNPYALLGLGAVRENTGDYAGAERLYAAARRTGYDAQANYTYITEQRLERAANRDVASLAEENLVRLTVKRAALSAPVPATTGLASYDGGTASVVDDTMIVTDPVAEDIPAFGLVADDGYGIAAAPVVETDDPQPVESHDAGIAHGYGAVSGGDYQQVGAYDDYAATLGELAGPVHADGAISTVYGTLQQSGAYEPFGPAIEPASYGFSLDVDLPVVASVVHDAVPLPYDQRAMVETVPVIYADAIPVYGAVSQLAGPNAGGPPGGLLAYGQSLGEPVDLVAATRPATSIDPSGSAEVNVIDRGGLIFLDDG